MKKASRIMLLTVITLLLTVTFSGAKGPVGTGTAPSVGVKQVLSGAQVRKDETVYAALNYDGSVNGITVSNRVVLGVDGTYTDHGSYTEVTPMSAGVVPVFGKGCVSFELKASPSGFSYAGRLSGGELPVSVGIEYALNGEKVDDSALAGASGDIVITLKISPNPNCAELYASRFLCRAEIPVDLTRCHNVSCSGGTPTVAGDTETVSVAVLPGASSEASVSFTAVDFQMDGIALVLTPFSYASLDLSALGTDVGGFGASAENAGVLENALSDYIDGLKKLSAASQQLSSGMGAVVSGGDKLAGDYASLKNSVLSLISSVENLLPTFPQARRTAFALVISQLKTGLDDFEVSLAQYTKAASDSSGYVGDLSEGLSGLDEQSDGVLGVAAELAEGLRTAAELVSEENAAKPLFGFADPTAEVETLQFILETNGIYPELRTYTPNDGGETETILDRFLDLFR